MRNYLTYLSIYTSVLLLGACSGQMQPTTPTPTSAPPTPPPFVSETEAETLPMWVVVEREASITGDLTLLATLWAEDARIVDGRGTVATEDDYIWPGRDAILDRYTLAVFPAPPPPLALSELVDANILLEEGNTENATLVNGGDRWRFVFRDGRWWLYELVYSAP